MQETPQEESKVDVEWIGGEPPAAAETAEAPALPLGMMAVGVPSLSCFGGGVVVLHLASWRWAEVIAASFFLSSPFAARDQEHPSSFAELRVRLGVPLVSDVSGGRTVSSATESTREDLDQCRGGGGLLSTRVK